MLTVYCLLEQNIPEQQVHWGGHKNFGEAVQDGFPHWQGDQGKVFGHCQESFSKVRPELKCVDSKSHTVHTNLSFGTVQICEHLMSGLMLIVWWRTSTKHLTAQTQAIWIWLLYQNNFCHIANSQKWVISMLFVEGRVSQNEILWVFSMAMNGTGFCLVSIWL